MSDLPKVQHYVPQFILRNHCKGRKDLLWTFDKQNARTFQSNIRNLAASSYFYDADSPDGRISLEPALAKIESQTKPLISELLKHRRLDVWSQADREVIALFLASQHLRTQAMRDMQTSLESALRDRLAGEQMTEEFRQWLGEPSEEANKQIMLNLLSDAHQFVPHFLDKVWCILGTSQATPFYIGDHPVALHNSRRDPLRGTRGLAVEGIEIYFPVSPTLTLGLLSPELGTPIGAVRNLNQPMPCSGDNVIFQNSLQIAEAARFVFCMTNEFALVRQMLADNPQFARGRSIQAH
jgi:hypothetical protein